MKIPPPPVPEVEETVDSLPTSPLTPPSATPSTYSVGGARRLRVAGLVVAVLAVALIASGSRMVVLTAPAGLWLALGLPAQQLWDKVGWGAAAGFERLVFSLCTALLLLMLTGLAANTLLPLVGVSAPLGRSRLLASIVLLNVVLWTWRRDRSRIIACHVPRGRLCAADKVLLVASPVLVLLAVAGAIRLNNNAGGTVTVIMLFGACTLLALLWAWRERLSPTTVALTIYLVATALLLMTSLRGWYVTGHDSQREYEVFKLTADASQWNIASYRDAYNACLSITILPTILAKLTAVSAPYVYKVIFQLLFALCPVIVYRVAAGFVSKGLALAGTIYFLAFPTFFTDMPFLNRQEVAFLFFGAAVVLIGMTDVTVRRRRLWLGIFSIGMVLSHYSTTYFFCGVLVLATVGRYSFMAIRRLQARRRDRTPRPPRLLPGAVVASVPNLAFLLLAAVLWNGLITNTASGVAMTLRHTAGGLIGIHSPESKSSDVSYSLLSRRHSTPEQTLAAYNRAVTARTSGAYRPDVLYSTSQISAYKTPIAPEPELPLTSLGKAFAASGVSVEAVNSALRQGSARLLQILILIGIIAVAVGRRRRATVRQEFYFLAFAALTMLVTVVVLPSLSIDYGILRAFQQGLFFLSPFLALGSMVAFGWLGTRRAARVTAALALTFFLCLTGVIPYLLGGYQPQLHLSNSGEYYDVYYTHPQEVVAATWVRGKLADSPGSRGAQYVQTDTFTRYRLQVTTGLDLVDELYPALLRKDTYVFLGYATTRRDISAVLYSANLIPYQYPIGLLDETRNRVYSNGGATIYR